MKINPLHCCDFYKTGHRQQYPKGTTMVYSNLTARSDRLSTIPEHLNDGTVVCFGIQYFIKDFLVDAWRTGFFGQPKSKVVAKYKRRMDTSLGVGAVPIDHIEALWDLGYLPICIKALPEGSLAPFRVPMLVIYNTHPDFFWLTNYLETALSCYLWKPMTSATVARAYRRLLERYAKETGASKGFIPYQAHDFSARGMSGPEDAALSGAGHLCSFRGTDSVAAIDLIEEYYNGYAEDREIGSSVPASEHSVMSMGSRESEVETFRRFITELYPRGIVSIVSDTWDFWNVITEYARELKPEIMARDGKLVFRPDSGDPVKIICGDGKAPWGSPQQQGAVVMLWKLFGGTVNDKGYRTLDSHVGLIYGDSITLERAEAILDGLRSSGFASDNITFGVGSYTYQHVTRDTFGFAVKSTYGEIDGVGRDIFKDPVTDSGTKKSARGRIAVVRKDGQFTLVDQQPQIDMPGCCMREVFRDGKLLIDESIYDIRNRAAG